MNPCDTIEHSVRYFGSIARNAAEGLEQRNHVEAV